MDPCVNELTVEELRCKMFEILRDEGSVNTIRAQLRRIFITKMQRFNAKLSDTLGTPAIETRQAFSGDNVSIEHQIVHGLIQDYLSSGNFENTKSIFLPEIGGFKNLLQPEAILKMLPYARESKKMDDCTEPILVMLIKELLKRCQAHTMSSSTQTGASAVDHRSILENELRKVESEFLAKCEAYRQTPSREENLRRQQIELQESYDKKLQEEVERFKSQELEELKVREQKRQKLAMEELRIEFVRDFELKVQTLADKKREQEAEYAKKKAEMEGSLFELRQQVFKKMDQLRIEEAEMQSRYATRCKDLEAREQFIGKREEALQRGELDLETLVANKMRHKELLWAAEKERKEAELKQREDCVSINEIKLQGERDCIAAQKSKYEERYQELQKTKEEIDALKDRLHSSERSLTDAESNKKRLRRELEQKELSLRELQKLLDEEKVLRLQKESNRQDLSKINKKLEALLAVSNEEKKSLAHESKRLQSEIIAMKMEEATAVGAERRKILDMLETERTNFLWKEDNLLNKIHELRSRLSEAEAASEKYQAQYEDEKIHVTSLRQEVNNQNILLAQAQSIVNIKNRHRFSNRDRSNVCLDGLEAPKREYQAGYQVQPDKAMMTQFMRMMKPMLERKRAAHTSSEEDSPILKQNRQHARVRNFDEEIGDVKTVDQPERVLLRQTQDLKELMQTKRLDSEEKDKCFFAISQTSLAAEQGKSMPLGSSGDDHKRSTVELSKIAFEQIPDARNEHTNVEELAQINTASRELIVEQGSELSIIKDTVSEPTSNTETLAAHQVCDEFTSLECNTVLDARNELPDEIAVSSAVSDISSDLQEEGSKIISEDPMSAHREEIIVLEQSEVVEEKAVSVTNNDLLLVGDECLIIQEVHQSMSHEEQAGQSAESECEPADGPEPVISPTASHVEYPPEVEEIMASEPLAKISVQPELSTQEIQKQEDFSVIDVYRQRVLARRAAERDAEAAKYSTQSATQISKHSIVAENEDDDDLESSSASFAESSKESSGSF